MRRAKTGDPIARPTLTAEAGLRREGAMVIAGVDEVGRGAWAGPVVAAAVILPLDDVVLTALSGVRDSKELLPAERERLVSTITGHAMAIGIGSAAATAIDRDGLVPATVAAMNGALAALEIRPEHVLVDGLPLQGLAFPHTAIVRGDTSCLSIAAASVMAKVARDRLMIALDGRAPRYSFGRHKGYGTRIHRQALSDWGPCSEHRLTVRPVAAIVAQSWL